MSTLAGGEQGYADGIGTNAPYLLPTGITVAADGTAYVADAGNDRVRKITPEGIVSTFAVYGNSENIDFNHPTGIAISTEGTLFVADANNHKIHKITFLGGVSTLSGNVEGAQDGLTNEAQFNNPTDIAVAIDGTLYIADATNQRIRLITPAGWVRTLTRSNTGNTDGEGVIAKFYFPAGLPLTTSGILYVAETGNSRIRKINLE